MYELVLVLRRSTTQPRQVASVYSGKYTAKDLAPRCDHLEVWLRKHQPEKFMLLSQILHTSRLDPTDFLTQKLVIQNHTYSTSLSQKHSLECPFSYSFLEFSNTLYPISYRRREARNKLFILFRLEKKFAEIFLMKK